MWWSGAALTEGVVEKKLGRVPVRITTPARTVADCFKYRSKVGLDVALEALRDYRTNRAGSLDDLQRAATVCRVGRVIRPYLEAMTWPVTTEEIAKEIQRAREALTPSKPG